MICNDNIGKYCLIFDELFIVVFKIYLLVENCRDEKWCEATIFQMKNKETFRELLLDLKHCFNASKKITAINHVKELEGIASITFNVTSFDEVKEDDESFYERLISEIQDACLEDLGLVEYLLQRYKDLYHIEGGELDTLDLSNNTKGLQIGHCKIGEGEFGVVYKLSRTYI